MVVVVVVVWVGLSDGWVGIGGWVLVVSFFAMGFDLGMGIDCGVVVVGGGNFIFWLILVVENWCLWLCFGGNWKVVGWVYWRERQKGRKERMNCL